jgi:uncharacterized phage infection (PIP) family protein YhgE
MSYDISYVLCLVSYVFHIAFAYMLMFRDAYVLMFRDLIFKFNVSRARGRIMILSLILFLFLFLFLFLSLFILTFEKPPHLPADFIKQNFIKARTS